MKQILQDLSDGETHLIEAPMPNCPSKGLLIVTSSSLISVGTERMLLDFGRSSYLQKARQQPEKVKEVIEKIKTDGLFTTLDAVKSKLSEPLKCGYCNVGAVQAVGADVSGFQVGDRVVSNGHHADMVAVPQNLCVRIPDNVTDESAVFTVLASIALQGIRLLKPTLGETIAVIGAGLIGLLTIQLLRANGCRVLAIDLDEDKLKLAKQFGAETCLLQRGVDPVVEAMAFSRDRGIDGVLITATTTSNDPVTQAAKMSRKRGRIVLVGVVGLTLSRADFYEKELTFQVSCSYGPGRYDAQYEAEGIDYPVGYVRWTEQRNFEAVLDMMASGQLDVQPLITHCFDFEEAKRAYQVLSEDKKALGIVLQYHSAVAERQVEAIQFTSTPHMVPDKPTLGLIGAGNYARRQLIPAFKKGGAKLHAIATSGGVTAAFHGKKAGFSKAVRGIEPLLLDSDINLITIATRHDSHADFVTQALQAGKHVFVEKPLALTLEELASIEAAYHLANLDGKSACLMVGFNRRFSPLTQKMKALLVSIKVPQSIIMTVNAGAVPTQHWTQDLSVGGGRIVGEACHFIDLMRFLVGEKITSVQVKSLGGEAQSIGVQDNASITLGFADGSFGTIHYLANGSKKFPKERIEVFSAGRVLQLDNFRKLTGFGWSNFSKMHLMRQDKGQLHCVKAVLDAIEHGGVAPIPVDELFEVTKFSIEASNMIKNMTPA